MPIYFRVESAKEYDIPGYYIIYANNGVKSIAEMPVEQLTEFAKIVQETQLKIQQTINPEKIYCLSFCEVLTDFHLHLFPRTKAMAQAFLKHEGLTMDSAIDGAKLFGFVRALTQIT